MLHENDSRSGHPSWVENDVYTGEPREQLPLTEPKMSIRSRSEILADPDDALWTVEETASVLRIERRTVSNLPGLVRTEMQGRGRNPMVRYLASDVRKYIRECRREAVA